MNLKELPRALHRAPPYRHRLPHEFELKRAQDASTSSKALKIAVDNIDEVGPRIIRKSKDTPSADASLRKRFKLSEKQSAEDPQHAAGSPPALEITKLERSSGSPPSSSGVQGDLGSKPGAQDPQGRPRAGARASATERRKPEIVADQGEFSIEDLMRKRNGDHVSHAGYNQAAAGVGLPAPAARRPGRDLRPMIREGDDWVEVHLFSRRPSTDVMFFNPAGAVYWLKVHEIPQAAASRARGKPNHLVPSP